MDCSMPGFPVHHQLPELAQTHVHWVSDAMKPPHPLSSPSPAFNVSQHQGLFQWISYSHQEYFLPELILPYCIGEISQQLCIIELSHCFRSTYFPCQGSGSQWISECVREIALHVECMCVCVCVCVCVWKKTVVQQISGNDHIPWKFSICVLTSSDKIPKKGKK